MSVAFGMFPTNSPNVYENTSRRVCAAQGIRLVNVGVGKWCMYSCLSVYVSRSSISMNLEQT